MDIRCIRMRPYKDGAKVLLDIETVIPLPEAEDYQVQIREKQQKEKISKNSTKDLTKYQVTISGKSSEPLPKRRAMFSVVQELCRQGVSPEKIHEVLQWRASNLWRVVEGNVSSEQFFDAATKAASDDGPAFDPRRWFYSDSELIHFENRTYAFSKMWGERTIEGILDLLARFPDHEISFSSVEG